MTKSHQPSLSFLFRHVCGYVRIYKWLWASLLVLAILVSAISLAQPLVFRSFIDDALLKRDVGMLTFLVLVYLAVALGSGLLRMTSTILRRHIELRTMAKVRDDLFFHLEHLDLGFFRKQKTGDLLERLEVDAEGVQDAIALLAGLLLQVLGVVFLAAISFTFDWRLTLVALVVIPFYVITQRYFASHLWPLAQRARLSASELLSFLEERITGILLIQVLGREKVEQERERELGLQVARSELQQSFVSNIGAFSVNLISIGILLMVLWYGGYQVINGSMTVGTLLALYTYLSGLFGPIESIANFWSNMQTPLASIKRVAEIQERAPKVHDARRAITLKNVRGDLQFDRVTFKYDPSVSAVKDINLRIRAGEHIGLVGPTGCGKSTLAFLLLRMYQPQSGRITLDKTDLNRIKLRSIRSNVSYLPQETILFNATVRENIALGSGRAVPLSTIRHITERLGIDDFLLSLPNGYDTVIGEKGLKLSVGQRQLLGITRLLLRKAPVVILDEATSALDAVTESKVREVLSDFLKDRTAIYIAHRLRTVSGLDRIIVMDQGSIVESGTFDELKKRPGTFKRFYQAQKV